MGTDIHMYVEKWEPDYDSNDPKAGSWRFMMHEDTTYGDRNYDVFAVLADVRNGLGFAGVPTGEGFNIIALPRGLPKDMSAEMARCAKERLEHTPSWLLVSEVLNFNWQQVTTHFGVVGVTEYLRWKREGKPKAWSGGISGPGIVVVSPGEMEAKLVGKNVGALQLPEKPDFNSFNDALAVQLGLSKTYCNVTWTETYEESCKHFLAWVRGLVAKSRWEGDNWVRGGPFGYEEPNQVRLVFWFDS